MKKQFRRIITLALSFLLIFGTVSENVYASGSFLLNEEEGPVEADVFEEVPDEEVPDGEVQADVMPGENAPEGEIFEPAGDPVTETDSDSPEAYTEGTGDSASAEEASEWQETGFEGTEVPAEGTESYPESSDGGISDPEGIAEPDTESYTVTEPEDLRGMKAWYLEAPEEEEGSEEESEGESFEEILPEEDLSEEGEAEENDEEEELKNRLTFVFDDSDEHEGICFEIPEKIESEDEIPWAEILEDIEEIVFDETFADEDCLPVSLSYWFYGMENVEEIDLSPVNTENTEEMISLFEGCTSLHRIYVSEDWNAEEISEENSENMFLGCDSLEGPCGTTLENAEERGIEEITSAEAAVIDTYENEENGTPGYFCASDVTDLEDGMLTVENAEYTGEAVVISAELQLEVLKEEDEETEEDAEEEVPLEVSSEEAQKEDEEEEETEIITIDEENYRLIFFADEDLEEEIEAGELIEAGTYYAVAEGIGYLNYMGRTEAVSFKIEKPEEEPEEVIEENPEGTAEENPEENVEEEPEEVIEEKPEEVVEENPEEVIEENSEETVEENPEGTAEENPEGTAEENPEEIVEDLRVMKAYYTEAEDEDGVNRLLFVFDDSDEHEGLCFEIPERIETEEEIPWADHIKDIDEIVFDGSFADPACLPVSLSYWFFGMENVEEIDLSCVNTVDTEEMISLFENCAVLSRIYVSGNWNTGNVSAENSENMFLGCDSLEGPCGTSLENAEERGIEDAASIEAAVIDTYEDEENGTPGYFFAADINDITGTILTVPDVVYTGEAAELLPELIKIIPKAETEAEEAETEETEAEETEAEEAEIEKAESEGTEEAETEGTEPENTEGTEPEEAESEASENVESEEAETEEIDTEANEAEGTETEEAESEETVTEETEAEEASEEEPETVTIDREKYRLVFFADEDLTEEIPADELIDAGTYYAVAEGLGYRNCIGRSETVSFEILKADPCLTFETEEITILALTEAEDAFTNAGDGELSVSADPEGILEAAVSEEETVTVKALKAGSCTVTLKSEETDNYLEGTASFTVTIDKIVTAIPQPKPDLVYLGVEQPGFNYAEGVPYTLEGAAGIDQGFYAATAILNDPDNYVWTNGTSEDQTIEWTIGKRTVTVTPASVKKAYGTQDPVIPYAADGEVNGENVDFILRRAEGETVGTYAIDLIPGNSIINENYEIVCREAVFTIEKAVAELPKPAENLKYIGVEQDGLIIAETDPFTAENTKAADAGVYQAVLKLKDAQNYIWADGTVEDKTVEWKIEKAESVLSAWPDEWTVGTEDSVLTLISNTGKGDIQAVSENDEIAFGTVFLKYEPEELPKEPETTEGTQEGTGEAQTAEETPQTSAPSEDPGTEAEDTSDEASEEEEITGVFENAAGYLFIFGRKEGTVKLTLTALESKNYKASEPLVITVHVTAHVDKTALNRVIGFAEDLIEDDYLEEGLEAFRTALEGAKMIAEKRTASPADIDYAASTLVKAVDALVKKRKAGVLYVSPDSLWLIIDSAGASAFYYNGDAELEVSVSDENVAKASVDRKTNRIIVSGLKLGKTVVTVTAPKTEKYEAAEAKITVSVNKIPVKIPAASEGLVYNRFEQTGVPASGDGLYTVSGGSAVDAGTYTAVLTLADPDKYIWEDGSADAKTLTWSIAKAESSIAFSPLSMTVYYMGTDTVNTGYFGDGNITLAVNDPDVTVCSYENQGGFPVISVYGKNAGETLVHVTASEGRNYLGTEADLHVTVKPIPVSIPAAVTGLVYDGTAQTGVYPSAYALYEAVNGTNVNAGVYTAAVILNDKRNYIWADGTPEDHSIEWSVAKRPVTITPADSFKIYGEADPAFTAAEENLIASEKPEYTLVRTEGEASGTYEITVMISGSAVNDNYEITCGSAVFTIAKAQAALPYPVTGLMENGYMQQGIVIPQPELVSYENIEADRAGDYTAHVYLKDPANYVFADGTSEDRYIVWSIAPLPEPETEPETEPEETPGSEEP